MAGTDLTTLPPDLADAGLEGQLQGDLGTESSLARGGGPGWSDSHLEAAVRLGYQRGVQDTLKLVRCVNTVNVLQRTHGLLAP